MWERGIIVSDSDEVLAKPFLSLQQIKELRVPLKVEPLTSSPGSTRIVIGPVIIDSHESYVTEYFNGKLVLVSLNLSEEGARRNFGTHANECELDFYKGWIRKQTGLDPPVKLEWGTINASLDHWTLEPYLSFRYLDY